MDEKVNGTPKPAPTTLTQREAMYTAFVNLCQQYEQLGHQLKTISELIQPYLSKEQELVPERTYKVEPPSPPPSTIIRPY